MSRGKRLLAGLLVLVLLTLTCTAASAAKSKPGKPGVWEVTFYARKGGSKLYVWKTNEKGRLTKELRSAYRTGFVFMGWYTHPYGGRKITDQTVFTDNTSVWAHWGRIEGRTNEPPKPGVYTVSFLEDDQSRTLPSTVQTGEDGKIAELPEPTVEKVKDLKFLGWRNRKTLAKVTTDTVFTGSATLQAVWGSLSKVNLTYISNGCIISNKVYPEGKWVDSLAGKPDNGGGRQFLGWYTEEKGGEKITGLLMLEDRTVYAHWSDPGFTVHFADATAYDEDGNQLAGNMLRTKKDGTLAFIPGGTSNLGAVTGWYLDRNRAVPLDADTVFRKDTRVWAKVEKTQSPKVRLDVQKYGKHFNRLTPGTVSTQEDGTLSILPTPVWAGNGLERRQFLGWFTEDDKPVTKDTVFTENTTIYAKWTEGHKITFDNNARPEFRAAYTDESGKLAALPAIGKLSNGSPAIGWFTPEGEKVTEDTVFDADTTLKAKWGVTVRFYTEKRNGWGYGDAAVLTAGEDGKLPYLPKATHPKGYPFAGWVDENGDPVTEETVFAENARVFATWETEGFVIHLSAGKGGSADAASVRTRNDGTVDALPSAHHKNGLPFRGWSSTEDGYTPVAADTVFTESTTLYANWIPAYKVSFRSKGGYTVDGTGAVMTDEEGHVAVWPEAEHPLKLHFDGWFTSQRGDAEKEGPQSVFKKDTWVDARWSVPEVPAGGFPVQLIDREETAEFFSTNTGKLKNLPVPKRSDAVFYGWFTGPAATGQKVRNGNEIGGGLTLYAAWLIPLTEETDR